MRRIYAITRNTITQGLKMKVSLILVAFLLITVMILPVLIKSDGTAKGQAQLILTYTLNIASFLLYILAAFLATATITNDLTGKQIWIVDISPARRWEILLGKWLGTVLLCGALLGAMGVSVYIFAKKAVKPAGDYEKAILQQELFTARTRLKPAPPDVDAIVTQYYEALKKEGLIKTASEEKQVLAEIRRFCQKYPYTVMPQSPRYWKFAGLPVPDKPDALMTVRYKLNAAQKTPDGTLRCLWSFGSQNDRTSPQIMTKEQAGSFHEFLIPASAIKTDGTLNVGFVCLENTSVIFDKENGLEILYKSSSFEINFVKCLTLIFIKIGFLSALGLAAGTFLTFPVASFFVFYILGLCLLSGPLAWIFNFARPDQLLTPPSNKAVLLKALWHIIRFTIPDFFKHSGITRLVSGEVISAWDLIKSALLLNFIYGGALFLLGTIIFARKEIADTKE